MVCNFNINAVELYGTARRILSLKAVALVGILYASHPKSSENEGYASSRKKKFNP
jgi:hypothetical protein